MPKNAPDRELVELARTRLSEAITNDAIEAQGPFRRLHEERGLPPIWTPRTDTVGWIWNRSSNLFAFSMDSSESQVNAYWIEGMDKAYVAHNGQQRNIAYNSIIRGSPGLWRRV